MNQGKTYKIITFGCQMNKSESERVATVLDRLGYVPQDDVDEADLVILNSCSVRQSAIDRIWGYARNLNQSKAKKNQSLTTILTGCLLPQDKKKFADKFDLVFNIRDIEELVNFLSPNAYIEDSYFDILPKYKSKHEIYVPIMTGCDNFCTYCCVPFTKGREIYRSVKSILDEIKTASKFGVKQVTLLGQNVNTYQPSDVVSFQADNPYNDNFAKLLWEVNAIDGVERIHYTAPHPKDMTDEVIDALTLPKAVNYLHLPLQSGDDEMLKKMNRKYTTADYYQIIEKVRKVKTDIALGTDLIVGFPGETNEQFENTYNFYQKVGFDISYTAMFSPRQGTPAARLSHQIDQAVKKQRWNKMQALMEQQTLTKNQKYIGQTVSVLVDNCKSGYCEGNSLEMKRVRFDSDQDLTGEIVEVKVDEVMTWLLRGEIENSTNLRKSYKSHENSS
jgi:tRNA-2-methylthio-N6-dimethylallyladenosine synthase